MFHSSLLNAPRSVKRVIMVSADLILLPCSIVLSVLARGDLNPEAVLQSNALIAVVATTFVSVFVFARLGLYRAVVRFMGRQALFAVFKGCLVSVFALIVAMALLETGLPRSIPLIYGVITLCLVGGSRFLVREYLFSQARPNKKRVAIYGAGTSGLQLMTSLNNSLEYEPVVLVDDLQERVGAIYHGVKVNSPEKLPFLIEKFDVEQVLLAIPSAPMWRRKEILVDLEPLPVRVKTVPTFEQLVSGDASVEETHDVAVEDYWVEIPLSLSRRLLKAVLRIKRYLLLVRGGLLGLSCAVKY